MIQPTWVVSSNRVYIVIHPLYGSASKDIPEAENLRNKKLYSKFRRKKEVKMMAINIVGNLTVFCIHGADKTIDQLV